MMSKSQMIATAFLSAATVIKAFPHTLGLSKYKEFLQCYNGTEPYELDGQTKELLDLVSTKKLVLNKKFKYPGYESLLHLRVRFQFLGDLWSATSPLICHYSLPIKYIYIYIYIYIYKRLKLFFHFCPQNTSSKTNSCLYTNQTIMLWRL